MPDRLCRGKNARAATQESATPHGRRYPGADDGQAICHPAPQSIRKMRSVKTGELSSVPRSYQRSRARRAAFSTRGGNGARTQRRAARSNGMIPPSVTTNPSDVGRCGRCRHAGRISKLTRSRRSTPAASVQRAVEETTAEPACTARVDGGHGTIASLDHDVGASGTGCRRRRLERRTRPPLPELKRRPLSTTSGTP